MQRLILKRPSKPSHAPYWYVRGGTYEQDVGNAGDAVPAVGEVGVGIAGPTGAPTRNRPRRQPKTPRRFDEELTEMWVTEVRTGLMVGHCIGTLALVALLLGLHTAQKLHGFSYGRSFYTHGELYLIHSLAYVLFHTAYYPTLHIQILCTLFLAGATIAYALTCKLHVISLAANRTSDKAKTQEHMEDVVSSSLIFFATNAGCFRK